jgi:hypothetical protein
MPQNFHANTHDENVEFASKMKIISWRKGETTNSIYEASPPELALLLMQVQKDKMMPPPLHPVSNSVYDEIFFDFVD